MPVIAHGAVGYSNEMNNVCAGVRKTNCICNGTRQLRALNFISLLTALNPVAWWGYIQ